MMSLFRRSYEVVSLLAILNLLGAAMLCTYLVCSGAVNTDKARTILAIVRGESYVPQRDVVPLPVVAEGTEERERDGTTDVVTESQRDLEIMRREAERIKAELDQRLALNNSILLRVKTQREQFQEERRAAAKAEAEQESLESQAGFQKQIALFETIAPKIAVEHLLDMPDPDEAARVLLVMETRKAKKIVEAAKRGPSLEKMKIILQRVRDASPDRSAELEADS